MAAIEIQGVRVDVGEDFLSLTPAQQSAAADEIFNSPDFQQRLGTQPDTAPEDQEAPQEPGFFERIGARLESNVEDYDKIVEAFQTEKQGIFDAFQADKQETFDTFQTEQGIGKETLGLVGKGAKAGAQLTEAYVKGLYQTFGQVVVGGLVGVAGEGLSTAAGGAFDVLKGVEDILTPEAAEPHIAARNQAIKAVWDETIGPEVVAKAAAAANSGFEAWQDWAEKNPSRARTFEATANIALMLAPVKVKPRVAAGISKPTIVGRAGEAVGRSTGAQVARERSTFIKDLVRPLTSKKVREAEILRTTEGGTVLGTGISGKRALTPSSSETAMAKAVATVPTVTPKNTQLANLNAIQAATTKEAKAIKGLLGRSPARISPETIKSSIDDTALLLAESPILVGDAARTGKRTLDKAVSLMKERPNTPSGVFDARQAFDRWVKRARPKVFDPATESALSKAVAETRDMMNNIVIKGARGVPVETSLARQTNLIRAMENIGPKAAEEAATAVGRLMQRVDTAIGLPKRLINISAEDMVTAIAKTTLSVGPAISKGAAKKSKQSLAFLLRTSEKAIQTAKRQNKMDLVRQLRADRAAVVEIVKAGQGEK